MGRFLDYSLSISQFCIGFVMLAGAGANLKQQFGLPLWVGSALMCVLVLITGLLDVDRVSALLGYITPLMVVLIIVAIVYGLATVDADWATASATAQETVPQPLPNWLFATLNYVGLCMFSGISMAILIGGSSWNTKAAGWGGFAGGMLFAVLLIALTVTFILQIDFVHDSDLPILLLLNQINPAIGVIASIATYGMIYSTTLGVIYSLSKRITVRGAAAIRPRSCDYHGRKLRPELLRIQDADQQGLPDHGLAGRADYCRSAGDLAAQGAREDRARSAAP